MARPRRWRADDGVVLAIVLAALAVVIAVLVVAVQPGPAHAHLARVLG